MGSLMGPVVPMIQGLFGTTKPKFKQTRTFCPGLSFWKKLRREKRIVDEKTNLEFNMT